MKYKHLFMVLTVAVLLLFYNMFCYSLINNMIDNNTRQHISNYFKSKCGNCNFDYKYLMATVNKDKSINVYIKIDKANYKVVFENSSYSNIIGVSKDIPAYIK